MDDVVAIEINEAYGVGISKIISCYKGLPVQSKFENVQGGFQVVLSGRHIQDLRVEDEKYLPILRLFDK